MVVKVGLKTLLNDLASTSYIHARLTMSPRLCMYSHPFLFQCDFFFTVTVAPPWEMKTFIPRGSSTYMNCAATNLYQTLRWSLQVFGSSSPVQLTPFTQDELNGLGFYSVSQDDYETILLLINGTVNNVNSTIIKCVDVVSLVNNLDIHETTLVVYGRFSVVLIMKY